MNQGPEIAGDGNFVGLWDLWGLAMPRVRRRLQVADVPKATLGGHLGAVSSRAQSQAWQSLAQGLSLCSGAPAAARPCRGEERVRFS